MMKSIFIRFKTGLALTAMMLLGAGTGALAQCDNFPNVFPANPVTPGATYAPIDFCNWAGELAVVNVVAGTTYDFSTCAQGAFPAASYDTQLTLRDNTGLTVLAYNDDFCGLQSQITWTATYTGVAEIHLNSFNFAQDPVAGCGTNQICTTILARATAPTGGPTNANNCADAVPAIEGLNTFVPLTGTGNSTVCSTGGTSAAWYTYTPAGNGSLDIYSCGAIDTRVSVYSGDCAALVCEGQNDDIGTYPCQTSVLAAGLTLEVLGGVTYYIEWDNRWSSAGADWNLVFTAGVPGCTNAAAVNFNPAATTDDGSCIVPPCADAPVNQTLCYGNGNSLSFFYEPTTAGEQVVIFFNAGTVESATFDQLVIYDGADNTAPILYANPVGITTQLNGLVVQSTNGNGVLITLNTDGSVSCASSGTFLPWDYDVYCASLQVPGCTDPGAPNFDPAATIDDGSCLPACTENEVSIEMVDSFGDGWNGATYSIIDVASASVVATGTMLTGSSQTDFYCLPSGCYTLSVTGGGFPFEVSWNLNGADAGALTGGALAVVDFTLDTPEANCALIGCTDPTATNFDPTALIDNGACVNCGGNLLLEISMTDAGNGGWSGASYSIVNVNNGTTVATGSLSSADSGNPLNNGTDFICLPEGCYVFNVTGGTNPANIGWEINDVLGNFYGSNTGNVTNFPLAVALGNAACSFAGCTNPVALNFVPSATTDDGSCIIPPANDQCLNAEAVTCGLTVSGSTINATDDSGLIGTTCSEPVTSPGVWYQFNAAADQFVTASTCGTPTGGDTKITVYTGDCNNLVCVAGNDDGCGVGFLSSISFNAETGNDYFIYVSEFGVGTGINFDLSITCEDCSAGFPTNDDCVDALPLLDGTAVTASTCCNAPSGAPNFIAAQEFATAYDQWFVFNSGSFDTFSFLLQSLNGEVVGLMIYDGDCGTLVDIAGAQALTVGGSIEAFLTLQPNTDYYFAVFTLDPATCGEFQFTANGVILGCTDQTATNFDPAATQDDGTCDYTGVTQPNDLCENAIEVFCADNITGSTGGTVGIELPSCDGSAVAGCLTATFGQFPGLAFTPTCAGGFETITGFAWTDEFSVVNLTAGQDYTFSSSDASHVVTIADAAGTTVLAAGNGSVVYTAAAAGPVRFYTHLSDACDGATIFHVRQVACGAVSTPGVWYSFTGTGELVTLETCGSVVGANLNVYAAADCASTFTCVTEYDDAIECDFFNADDASFAFISEVGVDYYIAVTSSTEGAFLMNVSCVPVVEGCTNPAAYNFNAAANVEDGSCDFFSGTCTAGGTPVLFNMFDSFGDGWNGATYSIEDGLGVVVASGDLDGADFFLDEDNFIGPESGFDFVCLQDGCYTITVGGGGIFDIEVSWNIEDENGNILAGGAAGTFDLVLGASTVCGCTNSGACNFDPTATSEDGSCEFDSCAGCTDATACNFDETALIDNGTCCFDNCVTTDLIPVAGSGSFQVFTIDGTLVASVSPTACVTCPVTPPAGVDVNTACYQDIVAADPFCCNVVWDAFCQLTYDACAAGSPDVCSAADPALCLADGCYYVVASGVSWTLFGVNGGFISGGDAEAEDFVSFSVGSITCQVGCTEPTACNFDPAANVPDCTLCEYNTCVGCTYPDAENFNPNASIDDQSCTFDLSSDCPADLNGDGLINATDLSVFLSQFGTFCN